MNIQLFDSKHSEEWDEFVKSSPMGTCYHLSGWANVLQEVYNFRSFSVMAVDNSSTITGILPLFMMRDILGKKYLVSNPFLNYAGVCALDSKTEDSLVRKAEEIAVENNVEYVELKHLSNEVNNLETKKDCVTMFLDLRKGSDFVWKHSFRSTTRNRIRKGVKAGLTVDFGSQYLDEFYKVLSTNLRDLGTPIHPKKLFQKILEEFNSTSGIIVVKHHDKVIGGMFYIYHKKVFSDPWVSTFREYNNLCPSDFLYWEAIKYAAENGFEDFDFGRSTLDSGTYRFKEKWGAKPVQLNYQYFLNKADKIPKVNANDNKYQLAINLWKRLPLIITNTLGPKLVKYLPEL